MGTQDLDMEVPRFGHRGWTSVFILLAALVATGLSSDLWDQDDTDVITLDISPPRVLVNAQESRPARWTGGGLLNQLKTFFLEQDESLAKGTNATLDAAKNGTNATKCEDKDSCDKMDEMPKSALQNLCSRDIIVRRKCPERCKAAGVEGGCPKCKDHPKKCEDVIDKYKELGATERGKKCKKHFGNSTKIQLCPIVCVQECPLSKAELAAKKKAEEEKAEAERKAKEAEEAKKKAEEEKEKADEKTKKKQKKKEEKRKQRTAARKERR